MSTIIIGGGHGGVQVADSLRTRGYQKPITIIDSSPELPYQRPPLSKDYMKVGFDAEPLPIREQEFYLDNNITLIQNTLAESIDRKNQVIHTNNGSFPYENLVLAVGARPKQISCVGADAQRVHTLKTLEDATLLREEITKATRVVVIGAGFIGMEFAVAALKHGCDVSVLEFADRPMARALTPFTSSWLADRYKEHGINLRCGEGLDHIEKDASGNAVAVHSTLRNRYEADLVVVGIGVAPNVEIAENADLLVDNGIVVDKHLRTSDPKIFAIGDCASFPLLDGSVRYRLESVQNATDQGKHVAAEILESSEPYMAMPWFWSTQGRYRLQMTGVVESTDEIQVIGKPEAKKFTVLAFREGKLVGAESVNQPTDQNIVRRLLNENIELDLETAQSEGFSLREHLKHSLSATL